MTTVIERQRKLIRLMLEKIPQFVPQYRGKERAYVADFVRLLRHSAFLDFKGQQEFLNHCEEYISKYWTSHPDYLTLPFLWLSVAFARKGTELIGADQSGTHFIQMVTGTLRNRKGDQGIFPFLEQGLSLSDMQWEELQYQVHSPKYQPPLSEEDLRVVRWLYENLANFRITQLSLPYLRELMSVEVRSATLVKQFDTLIPKADFTFWVYPNFLRLGIWFGFLSLELPSTLSLTDVIDFANPANSSLQWARIRKEYLTPPDTRETQKYMGVIHLPQGQQTAFLALLDDKKTQGHILNFGLEAIEEYGMMFSFATYRPGEGFEHYSPQDFWLPLKNVIESTEETNAAQTPPVGNPLADTFIIWYRPGASEPLTPAVAGILKKLVGDFPVKDTPPQFDPLEKILLERLQQDQVLITGLSGGNIVIQLGLSTLSHLRLPRIDWPQLQTILRYSPNTLFYSTPQSHHIISRWPASLVQFLDPHLPWHKEMSFSHVVDAYRGKINPRDLDPSRGVWRTPLILQDYM